MLIQRTIILAFSLGMASILSAKTKIDYTIAPWQGDKKACLVLTFDDGTTGHWQYAAPRLEDNGWRGTFFVLSNWVKDWTQMRELQGKGHEIAGHSVDHTKPYSIEDPIELEKQWSKSYEKLSKQLYKKYLTMAWPYGDGCRWDSKDSLCREQARKYFYASRGVNRSRSYGNHYDYYKDKQFEKRGTDFYFQTNCYSMNMDISTNDLEVLMVDLIEGKGWCNILYHGIGGKIGSIDITEERFEEHLKQIKKHESKLWITTFENAVRYHKQRNLGNPNLLLIKANKKEMELSLTTNLMPKELYNYPLTIKLKKEAYWVKKIIQNGRTIAFQVTENEIVFDAIPNGGTIRIGL